MGDDVGFVLDDPLDGLAFLELQRLEDGCWEVDVLLVGPFLAGDELEFGRVSHASSEFVCYMARAALRSMLVGPALDNALRWGCAVCPEPAERYDSALASVSSFRPILKQLPRGSQLAKSSENDAAQGRFEDAKIGAAIGNNHESF